MKINKSLAIKLARQATDMAVKNSEVLMPYMKPSRYQRLVLGLNALNVALRMADKEQ